MAETTETTKKVPFAAVLRTWRQRLGLSQSQAAAELSIGLDSLRAWEHSTRRPLDEKKIRAVMEVVGRRIRAGRAQIIAG